jgi:hypothetical protein
LSLFPVYLYPAGNLVHLLSRFTFHGGGLDQRCLHGLKEGHVVSDVQGLRVGYSQGERFGKLRDRFDKPVAAVFLGQDRQRLRITSP